VTTKPAGFRQDPKTMTQQDAENVTADIVEVLTKGYTSIVPLIVRAFRGRAWNALGFSTWSEYCAENFTGDGMLRLPDAMVNELAGEGLSTRAIAAATGRSKSDVDRTINKRERPDNVVSLDGYRRPSVAPRTESESRAAHPSSLPAFPAWQIVVAALADMEAGGTYVDVCAALGWRDGKTTGALSEAFRRGEIQRMGERDGHAVWGVTPCGD
jgi:hypothetical protein